MIGEPAPSTLMALTQLVPHSVIALAAALIVERFLKVAHQLSPALFFKALCLGISAKVHPINRQSAIGQQKVAGTLAIIVLVFPFVFMFYAMRSVVEFPLLFDVLILVMCLNWSTLKKASIHMCKAIDSKNTSLAKARLSPWVLRHTEKLSPLGLCKAGIEMLILRASKEYFALIFYYLIFGGLFVLFYRLMTILNQCWNPKLSHYKHFGQSCHFICQALDWLPCRLMALTIMLLNNFKLSFELMARASRWGNNNSLMLLAATAAGLKVDLGGPVIYNRAKWRRPVIGDSQTAPPSVAAVKQTSAMLEKVLLIWLLVIILMLFIAQILMVG